MDKLQLEIDLMHMLASRKPTYSIAFEMYHDKLYKPGDDKHDRAEQLIQSIIDQAKTIGATYGIKRPTLEKIENKSIAQRLKDSHTYLGRKDAGVVELHLRDAIRTLVVAGTARTLERNQDNLLNLTGVSMKQLKERYDLSTQEVARKLVEQSKAIPTDSKKHFVTKVLDKCALQLSVSMPNDSGIRFEAKLPFPNVEQTFTSVTGTIFTNRVDTRAQTKKTSKPKAPQDEKMTTTSEKPKRKDSAKRSTSRRSRKSKSKGQKKQGK